MDIITDNIRENLQKKKPKTISSYPYSFSSQVQKWNKIINTYFQSIDLEAAGIDQWQDENFKCLYPRICSWFSITKQRWTQKINVVDRKIRNKLTTTQNTTKTQIKKTQRLSTKFSFVV